MAGTSLELSLLTDKLNELSRQMVIEMRDLLIKNRGNNVPDQSIIARSTEQFANQDGNLAALSKKISKTAVDTNRGIYQTMQSQLSAAMEEGLDPTETFNELRQIEVDLSPRQTDEARAARALRRQAELNGRIKNNKLIWVAVFVNTCKDCVRLAGQIKTYDEWQQSGILPGNGNTVCGGNCKCHLAPVNTLAKTLGIQGTETQKGKEIQSRLGEGIKIQNKKIDELEKLRGAPYAESTKAQLLGQIDSKRFNKGTKNNPIYPKK